MADRMAESAWRGDRLVTLIGAFKLLKAALLVGLGVIWFAGAAREKDGSLFRTAAWLGALDGHRVVRHAIARLAALDARALRALAIAAFAYAAVFAVEGAGLLFRKRWAEWMTVVVTGSFIPFEIYELARRPGPGKVVALALNVAIVVYLAWRRVTARAARRIERRSAAIGFSGQRDHIVRT